MLAAVGAALLAASFLPAARAGTLVSGPMLGYQAHREALIWLAIQ